jgi:hypothetical protein
MKKILIVLILFPLASYGQKVITPKNSLGIKGGGVASRMFFDPAIDLGFSLGYTAGLVFNHRSEKPYGVQAELSFTQWGWTEKPDSTSTYSRRLNYIHLPFLTHLYFGNDKTNLIINLGPYINYLLSEEEQIDLNVGTASRPYYNKLVDNSLGYGLCIGIGMSLKTSLGEFQFEARVNQGMGDIFNNTSAIPFVSSKTQAVEISLFYLIPLN